MKRIILSLIVLMTINISFAQNYLGLMQDNYSGALGASKNPGFLADNRMKFDMTILGVSTSGYNNHLYMNTRLMPGYWTQFAKDSASMNPDFYNWQNSQHFDKIVELDSTDYYRNTIKDGNFFTFDNPKNKHRNAFVNLNVDIFDMMVSLSETRSIGFGIKHRTMVNIDNVAAEIITLSTNELEYPTLWDLELSDKLLNISANSWMEYNFSYAQVFMDDEEHFIKAGIKLKFLQGLGAAYVYTDNVDYEFSNADTAAYIRGDFEYGYSADLGSYLEPLGTEIPTAELSFKDIYKMSSKLGIGVDIGGVYEWRPNWKEHKFDMDNETNLWRRDENKYKLRAAFSITDIGGMRYSKGDLSRNFKMDANVLDMAVFENVSGFRSFDTTILALRDSGQLTFNEDDGTFFMNLPTAINMNVDYQIVKNFYANFDASFAFQMQNDAHKTTLGSHIAITPRFERKWWGASMPVSIGEYTGFRTGLGLRLGPIHIGTGDLKPFLAPGKDWNVSGADFYIATKIPIGYSRVKDRDEDKVSDKVEKAHRKALRKETGNKDEEGCIDIPGVWEFQGCPDTDGDHIQDSKDSCVYDAGLKEFFGCPDTDGDKIIDKLDSCALDSGLAEFNGCPDRDGDKIIDKLDDCPDVAGLEKFNGCPDRDNDGIMDEDDLCPDDSGLVEFKGCPDRDQDGVRDIDDLCPDNPGPEENQGCPDTDKDGIFDYLDDCPEVAGPKENNGCPWPDTDEDGILDKDDKCPLNKGPKSNQGCPYKDTDKDGTLDKDDECVNTPGPKDNKGCPKIEEVDLAIINEAFKALEFETGKAVIRDVSFPSLDSLSGLMIKRDTWHLNIDGHTDNVGAATNNLVLSKKRAQAVADYLISKGVPEERLFVEYHGEDKPIADNNTKEGRQKNRRVEMTVFFE